MDNFFHILTRADNIPIVLMVPIFAAALGWAIAQSRRSRRERPGAELSAKVHTWPYLARAEFICAALVLIVLCVWSISIDAPLEGPADPNKTPNPAKAPWYFLGLQELLVYFDPWIAGVVIPTIILVALALIPYLDVNEKTAGEYNLRARPFAVVAFCFGFFILGLGLIVLGVFFRGPGWNFFWPWQYWDHLKVAAITNVNLPESLGITSETGKFLFGAAFEFGYYLTGGLVYLLIRKRPAIQKLGWVRYGIVAFLTLAMLAVPLKIVLRFFNIKYVWVTPWFNY